ncbi:ABC transporter ATP-binding protein [Metapseudomonas furukawaii]|uniref:ABC transporter ATP-binding protein n=1 Tax=Metapseudomonas furukawaii TaxID=1149133 RepID=UPI00227D2521|nr:ABC transporter ATP-binding protein [Pseudomonas furukawaii]WAG79755.1 ABC transporter ATP-binding protein [Pseudomonas furukawaii]
MSSISIRQLEVSYGSGVKVIDGLDLEIPEGSFFTLLGPSGCGKTTLLRVIAGFIHPTRGSLSLGAVDMTRMPPHRRGIGMVFQDYALFPDKTVFDNVAYGLRARKLDAARIRQKVGEYLERVGMDGFADRHPAALSGGQRQRVALARALAIEPEVLLMDEPLSNLDARLRLQIRTAIAELQREIGITTVFVTHDQEEALALSDQIALMRQGRIEQLGSPQAIYQSPSSTYVADFVGSANLLAARVLEQNDADSVAILVAGQSLLARTDGPLEQPSVHLVARPESIRLRAAGQANGNSLDGWIHRKQYLGNRTSYSIRLTDTQRVSVDRFGPDDGGFLEGQPVSLEFDPQHVRVVSR